MKILIISGFLGAGKTTFIKELIKKTNRDYCILENEYGSINVDNEVLKEDKKNDLNIVELTQGCVCCSSKGKFENSIVIISSTIDPDYLIIEPTGVGFLSSIKRIISKIEYERITLLPTVTIIDAYYVLNHLKDLSNEIFIDQIKNSERIIVSKSENLLSYEHKLIEKYIRNFNENCEIFIKHYKNYDESFFFNLLKSNKELNEVNDEKEVSSLPIEEFSIDNEIKIKSEIELISFLEDLTRGFYGDILRSKGYIKLNKYYLNFDLVNNLYSIRAVEKSDEIKEGIVVIGYNLNKGELRKRCSSLLGKKFFFQKRKLF